MIDYTLRTSLKEEVPIAIIYQDGIEVQQKEILVKGINKKTIEAYCYNDSCLDSLDRRNILSAMVLELSKKFFGSTS